MLGDGGGKSDIPIASNNNQGNYTTLANELSSDYWDGRLIIAIRIITSSLGSRCFSEKENLE